MSDGKVHDLVEEAARFWLPPEATGMGDIAFVLASAYDALASRLAEAERENAALRNLANNLQPGPISEAMAGTRYTREAELERRVKELEGVLAMVYDKYEDGTDCYEDPEDYTGYLGKAVKLSTEEESAILAVIPAERDALSPRHQSAEGAEGEGT